MKLEYRIVDRMIMDGTLKVSDLKKIIETKMYSIDMLYFSIFTASYPKYIIVFAAYYGNNYREDLIAYLNSLDNDSKTILDIYNVWKGFSILNYKDKIEKGSIDDIYRFIMFLKSDYPDDMVNDLISYLFENYPKVKEKYEFNMFVISLKSKTLKEFLDILIRNNLLEYFLKYKDMESFRDLEDVYYLLKVLNLDDNIVKDKIRNKVLNYLNNGIINQEMLKDIFNISSRIGLIEFCSEFKKLKLVIPIKNMIINCLREYFFDSLEILEENYESLGKLNDYNNIESKDLDIKTDMVDVSNKVFRKLYKSVDNKE